MRDLVWFPHPMSLARGLAVAALTVAGFQPGSAQPESDWEIDRLSDDVYVFRMTGYNALFIVTDSGVIATDPIGENRAPFYRRAIESVTDQPVRYVVYSHDHGDHIGGGVVFADTAEFVSQENAVPRIAARGDPLTPIPTIVFDDVLVLELGGKAVELYYAGRNHSDNNLLLVYPTARVAFGADFIEVESVFSGFLSPWLDEWVAGFAWIEENLDFDLLVAGHGKVGTKDAFRQAREYLQDLMGSVRAARAAGLEDDSEAMVVYVRERLVPTYGEWANFDRRLALNVAAVIRNWQGR